MRVPSRGPAVGTLVVMATTIARASSGCRNRLGRHGVNIGSFALAGTRPGAVGVISVDEGSGLGPAVKEMRD